MSDTEEVPVEQEQEQEPEQEPEEEVEAGMEEEALSAEEEQVEEAAVEEAEVKEEVAEDEEEENSVVVTEDQEEPTGEDDVKDEPAADDAEEPMVSVSEPSAPTVESTESTEAVIAAPSAAIEPAAAADIAELDEDLPDEIDTPKVLVQDLAESTDEEGVKEYFSKFGEVRVVKIKKDNEGVSRGFAFVIFSDPANIGKALEEAEHLIDSKAVQLTKAMPSSDKMKTNKLFIGGLPSALSEEQLREYFEKYGKIQNFQFIINKMTMVRKAFCFVVFESAESVEKITEGKVPPNSVVHTIEGHTVDCKKKFDEDHPVQRKIKARSAQYNSNRNSNYNQGGGGYNQGQYDAAAAAYAGYGAYGAYSGYEQYYGAYGAAYGAYPGYSYPGYPGYSYPGYSYPQQAYGSAYGPVKPNRSNNNYKPY